MACRGPRCLAIAIPALLALLLVGCASSRTVSGDHLAELHREAMLRQVPGALPGEWYYLGSDERYHYIARDDDVEPTYRVPRHEWPIDRPYAYDRTRSQRLLLQRQAPTLYPWERRLRPHPADLTERWGPSTIDRRPGVRPGVRHDPYGPTLRRSPPRSQRR